MADLRSLNSDWDGLNTWKYPTEMNIHRDEPSNISKIDEKRISKLWLCYASNEDKSIYRDKANFINNSKKGQSWTIQQRIDTATDTLLTRINVILHLFRRLSSVLKN